MADEKNQKEAGINGVPLIDILYRTLHYWPWVLLSLFVCMSLGVLYLLSTPNVYTQSVSILVKEDSKGKSMSTSVDDFADMGFFRSKTNIQNEIAALESYDLMEEVVRRLGLETNYFIPGHFHDNVAYGTSLPVKVEFVDSPDNRAVKFNLAVTPDGKVTLSDMKLGPDITAADEYKGVFGDSIKTAAGAIVVLPTPYFDASAGKINMQVVKSTLTAAARTYNSRLKVSQSNDKASVLVLTLTDRSIQRADEVLSTVVGVYNENWIRDKNQIAVSTSNFINERLNIIESELGNVDSDISSFKSEHLVPDIKAAATSYMAEDQSLSQEILTLNNQLQMTRYVRTYLANESSSDKTLPSNSGIDNSGIEQQIAGYNNLLLQRNNLASKSSDRNPLVRDMDKQLADIRATIVESVDNYIVTLQTQMAGLQGARGAATSKLASNPTQAKYLLSVERQQKVKESLYLFLLQKREENELSQAFTAYNTRIINRPGGSTAPTSPKRMQVLLVCFVVGLAIPFGVIYLMVINNTRIRGRKDVEDLSLPLLGEVPQAGNKKKDDTSREVLVRAGKRDIINESFRVLRTNVEFTRPNNDACNVIAITSFNPGSGKSFITMNLAASFSVRPARVLIIDGDMRHGSSSQYAGSPKQGLADYLAGNTDDVNSLLVKMPDFDTLYVLLVGTIPPNPTELLQSPRFSELVDSLRESYDYILIDCPPIEVVADAQIIDRIVDRTIFVIRAGLLERSMLPELDRLYNENKYKRMAFVLNGTRNEQGRYGYSHSYRYGYGYGYGYGYNYGSDSKK